MLMCVAWRTFLGSKNMLLPVRIRSYTQLPSINSITTLYNCADLGTLALTLIQANIKP